MLQSAPLSLERGERYQTGQISDCFGKSTFYSDKVKSQTDLSLQNVIIILKSKGNSIVWRLTSDHMSQDSVRALWWLFSTMRLTLVSEFQGHLKSFLGPSRNISLLQTLVLLFQFFFVCDFATPGDICRRKVPNFSSALRPRRCFLMLPLFSTKPTISFVDIPISFVFPTLLVFFCLVIDVVDVFVIANVTSDVMCEMILERGIIFEVIASACALSTV